jgi:predicted nucleotidyltransferase
LYKVCRIDIEKREGVYQELEIFVKKLRSSYTIYHVYLFGSAAEHALHEGSDSNLIIVGDFKERFFQRIANMLSLTSLPIEPPVYTREEFEEMKKEPFIQEILKKARELS